MGSFQHYITLHLSLHYIACQIFQSRYNYCNFIHISITNSVTKVLNLKMSCIVEFHWTTQQRKYIFGGDVPWCPRFSKMVFMQISLSDSKKRQWDKMGLWYYSQQCNLQSVPVVHNAVIKVNSGQYGSVSKNNISTGEASIGTIGSTFCCSLAQNCICCHKV